MADGYSHDRAAYPTSMKTDALDRRLRFAKPNPVVARLQLTERDFLLFEAINRHGPLPTNYLFELTKHQACSFKHLQYRLTELYNGDRVGPYLLRPEQQHAGYEARYQHLVYDLAPRARKAIAERGTLVRFSPKRTDPFLHQLMGACVAASFELTAPTKGLRYIPREEILSHPGCPAATKEMANPMAIPLFVAGPDKAIVPDDLFGLEYPSSGFRFFAVEIDRNTESIERKDQSQNTFGKKITGYLDILKNQTFKSHWGLPNLHVLTITTNANHGLNILKHVSKQDQPRFNDRFAMACEPSFGTNWRVPRGVLSHLLEQPWTTAGAPKDLSRP